VFHSVASILTIVAAMAVGINAQCAVSCSLQTAPPAKHEAHSCCKDQKVPASHKRENCPEPVLTIAPSNQNPDVQFFAVALAPLVDTQCGVQWRGESAAVRLYPIPDIPAFSILRI